MAFRRSARVARGREGIFERWVPELVARSAHPEALALLELLLGYGVAVPRFLAARYECLLAVNEQAEAEHTLAQLRAVANASGHIRSPLHRGDQHVDDIEAIALWTVAKFMRLVANGEHPFAEKRLGSEPSPTLAPKVAADVSRAYASRAAALFQRRATEPITVKSPLNYACAPHRSALAECVYSGHRERYRGL